MYETYSDMAFSSMHKTTCLKIHTRDKHPLPPPPTLKGLIYVRMEMLLNMVFKLIFTDLETRLYIV